MKIEQILGISWKAAELQAKYLTERFQIGTPGKVRGKAPVTAKQIRTKNRIKRQKRKAQKAARRRNRTK